MCDLENLHTYTQADTTRLQTHICINVLQTSGVEMIPFYHQECCEVLRGLPSGDRTV